MTRYVPKFFLWLMILSPGSGWFQMSRGSDIMKEGPSIALIPDTAYTVTVAVILANGQPAVNIESERGKSLL